MFVVSVKLIFSLIFVYLNLIKMRLITHNMLQCNIRGVVNGYPLKIEAESIEIIATDFDSGFYHIFN